MEVAKVHQDQLARLKKAVQASYLYFEPNYKSFNAFRRFVFKSSLTDSDRAVLSTLDKPEIEFNIGEAFISRLRGEFSKQQPNVVVTVQDGKEASAELVQAIGDHLRYILFEANQNNFENESYTDVLSGGFSSAKVFTKYANPMSFDQVLGIEKTYDATLVGFDPLARYCHKGDGRYAFELFPKSRDEFEQENPDIDLKGIDFSRNVQGFNWAYQNNQEDIILICDFYEKKKKRKKIVQLVNNYVMTSAEYDLFVDQWNASGLTAQPPAIKGKPRWTEIETVVRYRFIQNKVLEYVETDFPELPLVFFDGNSILIREGTTQGAFLQMTRPYTYHLQGLQKLKNFAGQTLANELENLVQHKFKVAKESLPDEQSYLDAYTNIQIANTLVYKAFKDNDPNVMVPPPQEIMRSPPPQEIISTFTLVDQMAQTILGSYDASLGINDNQLSGTAIVEGATQSNAAAMPYIINYMQSLTHIANMLVKMFPKYYLTPRTMPVVNSEGQRGYVLINQPGGIHMNYDENTFNVKVEAGVNFNIQKSRTLQQITMLSQAMPIFNQFINTKCLKFVVNNMDAQNGEELKELADQFMQEQAQQQQQAQQQAQQAAQNNPALLKVKNDQMKIQADIQKEQNENQRKTAELAINKQQADTDFLRVLAEMHDAKTEAVVDMAKAQAEETRASVDLAIKHGESHHGRMMDKAKHSLETLKTHHGIAKDLHEMSFNSQGDSNEEM